MKYTDDAREVEAVRKVLELTEVREAFACAYHRVFGIRPSAEALALLLAHSALETGRWKAGLWCYNFGNKKASLTYPGWHCYFRCNELINGKYEWFDPPHPQTRFRAYLTAADGAEAQIRFLGTATRAGKPNRYQAAWNALLAGLPQEFCAALHRAGYFTAHLGPYQKAVVGLYNEYLPLCQGYGGPVIEPEHDADDTPAHSARSDLDLPWIGDVALGLPDDIRADIAEQKRLDLLGEK